MNLGGNETTAVSQKAKLEAKEQAKRPPLFISKERDHKFDLLLHLITNLRQPLILCGARGVGKTRFLQQIDKAKSPQWTLVNLKSTRSMNTEVLYAEIVSQLQWGEKRGGQELLEVLQQRLSQLASQKKVLVLLLDDSGELSPGVISELFRFCESSQALRLVLSMTPDQLQIKQSTDPAVEDFHVVDIPALNEQQCGDYLRSLTAGPEALLSFKAINPLLVQTVYQETDGIPGKIQAMLPALGASGAGFIIKSQVSRFRTALFVLGSIGVLSVAGFFWLAGKEKPADPARPTSRYQPAARDTSPRTSGDYGSVIRGEVAVSASSAIAGAGEEASVEVDAGTRQFQFEQVEQQPEAEVQAIAPSHGSTVILPAAESTAGTGSPETTTDSSDELQSGQNKSVQAITAGSDSASEDSGDVLAPEQVQVAKQADAVAEKPELLQPARQDSANTADEKWIAEQASGNYTIQLIALSKESAVQKLVSKYSGLKPIAYFRSPRQKGDLFPLVYGSFASRSDALDAQKRLPAKLGKGWLRRFSSVQKEMRGE